MQDIIVWFKSQFADNEVFAGFVGGSLMASMLYAVKNLPLRLWQLIKWIYLRFLTVEVTLTNADLTPFLLVANWLNSVVGDKWNRVQLDFAGMDASPANGRRNIKKLDRALTLGYGSFGFWYKKTYVRVSRTREEETKGEGRRKAETLILRFFTRRRDIIDDVLSASQEEVFPTVYLSNGYGHWRESQSMVARRLDTIILPADQKTRIIQDLEWFFTNKEFYTRIGISCTRGYLFHGPPGTGKTSLARALAAHFKRDIYLLSLGDVHNDTALLELMINVSRGSFVVFDDVDIVGAVVSRNEAEGEKHGVSNNRITMEAGVTLGGLLQAIDGINAAAEHVLIFLTNRPEILDAALTRPGRMDIKEKIDLIPLELAEQMATVYFGEEFVPEVGILTYPASGAEVEQVLIEAHKKKNIPTTANHA